MSSTQSISRRSRHGFTLLELMIVVAIIGILAAIAIPNLQRLKRRAMSAEAGSNLAAIHKAEEIWFSEYGDYVPAASSPASIGGARRQPFVDVGGGFTKLGWSPEGDVFFRYAVATSGASYTADASADLDEDGVPQVWGYVHPDALGVAIFGVQSCSGVWSAETGTATEVNLVGPCGPGDGRTIF